VGEDERFDVVLCQQGFQFFPDRPAAAREMLRVLEEGGRLGISTWRPDDELPLLREFRSIAERHVGPIDDRRHAFGDGDALAETLRAAGFNDVRWKVLHHTIHFDDGPVFLRMNAMALVGMSAAGREMSDEERAGVVADIARECAGVSLAEDGRSLDYDLKANVATARR
jgi:SAM-dependent methyltransferase